MHCCLYQSANLNMELSWPANIAYLGVAVCHCSIKNSKESSKFCCNPSSRPWGCWCRWPRSRRRSSVPARLSWSPIIRRRGSCKAPPKLRKPSCKLRCTWRRATVIPSRQSDVRPCSLLSLAQRCRNCCRRFVLFLNRIARAWPQSPGWSSADALRTVSRSASSGWSQRPVRWTSVRNRCKKEAIAVSVTGFGSFQMCRGTCLGPEAMSPMSSREVCCSGFWLAVAIGNAAADLPGGRPIWRLASWSTLASSSESVLKRLEGSRPWSSWAAP